MVEFVVGLLAGAAVTGAGVMLGDAYRHGRDAPLRRSRAAHPTAQRGRQASLVRVIRRPFDWELDR